MNERVQELLADWEIARQDGNPLSPEELCRDCPELLADLKAGIEKLLHTSWLFDAPDGEPDEPELPSLRSRQEFLDEVTKFNLISASQIESIDGNADAASTASQFFDAGLLTQYQTDVLLGYKEGPIKFDRYIVLDEIGEGGMGKVYKALHTSMQRHVAIKMLSANSLSDQRKSRFRREIQTVASLNHPNIVTAYDACEVEGKFFLAMELIDGDDLTEVIQEQGPMDFDSASEVVRQIACAAEAAHRKGIIHRDIKPSNVVLTNAGPAKLLDLGIARILSGVRGDFSTGSTVGNSTEITGENVPIGTIAYMSPEQALSAKTADEQSDIYSLGCLFYYLLTGKGPFLGDNAVEVIVAHREAPIDDVLRPLQIPQHGRDILSQMMAKDPGDRFTSMNEVANAIESRVANPKVRRSASKASGKMRAVPLVAALLVFVCGAGGVAWYSGWLSPRSTGSPTELEAITWQNDLARWVLNHSGSVVARTEFGTQAIDEIEAIPNSRIDITELTLVDAPPEFSVQWLTRLPELESLTLDLCTLTNDDAGALRDLKSLRALQLQSCEMEGSFWRSLSEMSNLTSLTLVDVACPEESWGSLNNLSQLRSLTINDMELSDSDFVAFVSGMQLEHLDLENTLVENAPLIWVAKQKELRHLDLSGTQLTDEDLIGLSACQEIKFVSFESCEVGSHAAKYVAQLSKVEAVFLGSTFLSDADLKLIASNEAIVSLDIQKTKVTKKGLGFLGQMKGLEMLNLASLDIADDLEPLSDLDLSMIDLSDTGITDGSFDILSKMDLVELGVIRCDISENALDKFVRLHPSCDVIINEAFIEE